MINSILVWNCWGVGTWGTLRYLQELIKIHKISIVALLEPRIHSSKFVPQFHSEAMTYMITVEARGFAGGIWLMWNQQEVDIEEISSNEKILNVLIQEEGKIRCLLSVVYASPTITMRMELWSYISQLGEIVDIPWVVMEDFNQPLEMKDKYGGRPINMVNANRLRDTINRCRVVDIGFQGPRYTWTNCRTGPASIREQIDSVWCNLDWQCRFTTTVVQHLTQTYSDHHPILLQILNITRARFKGFRFLEPWFHHLDFTQAVEHLWRREPENLHDTMENFKCGIMEWNHMVFGNIFQRKKRCSAQLLGIQQRLATTGSTSLQVLESKLMREYDTILTQEELYWK